MTLLKKDDPAPRGPRIKLAARANPARSPVLRTDSGALKALRSTPVVAEAKVAKPSLPDDVKADVRQKPLPVEDARSAIVAEAPVLPAAQTQAPQPLLDLSTVGAATWQHRRLVLVMMIGLAAVGAGLMPFLPKKYSAETSLYFDPNRVELSEAAQTAPGLSADAMAAVIDSKSRILTSPDLIKSVAETLQLQKNPAYAAFGTGPDGGPSSQLVAKLADGVVSARETGSYVLTLMVSTKNPDLSAKIANEMVRQFIEGELKSSTGAYSALNSALDSRASELAKRVQETEEAVQAYKAQNDLVTADGNLIADQRLLQLNELLVTAQNKTIEAKAKVEFASKLNPDGIVTDSSTDNGGSTALGNLRRQYSEQAAKVGSLQSQLGSRHPTLLAAKASLDGLKAEIVGEQQRIKAAAEAQLQQAQRAEQEVAKQLSVQKALQGGSSQRQIELNELQRKADAARALYETVLKRTGMASEESNLPNNNIRVVSKAEPPLKADGPATSLKIVGGLFGGAIAGLMLGVLASLGLLVRSRFKAAKAEA